MSRLKQASLKQLILGTLLVYLTLHLLEEGLFGFPAWAENRWGIPGYTTVKWLIHNVYFAFFLVIGFLVYRRNPEKYLIVGLGVLVWGLLNTVNHLVFSIIFLEYSPGLFTGLIFALFAYWGWQRVKEMGHSNWRRMAPAAGFGLLYWAVPIVLFISVDLALGI